MASINKIEMNTTRLNSDVQTLRSTLGQARKHAEQMKAQMDSLNSSWDGPAKQAEMKRFEADYETIRSLFDVVNKLIENLDTIRSSYDACENNVLSTVNSLNVNG